MAMHVEGVVFEAAESGGGHVMRSAAPAPRRIEWSPAVDITPHELAQAMPAVVRLTQGGLFVERIVAGLIEAMPGSVRRHFRVEPAGAVR